MPTEPSTFDWTAGLVRLHFSMGADAPVALSSLAPRGAQPSLAPVADQPLVELSALGHGRFPGGFRHVDTTIGTALRYRSHHVGREGAWSTLRIEQADPATGIVVTSCFRAADDVAAFQTWTEVTLEGVGELVLDFVSILATGAWLTDSARTVDDIALAHAASDWCAESRWRTDPLRQVGLARFDRELHHNPPRSRCIVTDGGSWSTGEQLPTAALVTDGYGLAWQIEHNGPWLYELGETMRGAYLLLSGPTDQEHQWSAPVRAGVTITTPTASVALALPGAGPEFDRALAALTDQRRAIRQPRAVDATLPVGFNDYMNTLMGDPTTEKLLPLIDAAAGVGAELFCVDAGWYSDGYWWDSVGEWLPAEGRFPGGIGEVFDRIRSHGMIPGLWLEPEVIGVSSPLAASLPESAFFHRQGVRIAEHGRHLLDLRSPDALAHLDGVVDRLVGDLGVRFFKMDYNTMTGPGTDRSPDGTPQSPGRGLAEHSAAQLAWLDRIQARYPDLLIENCASGAMRMDYAMLQRLHLQSTSDQQDPVQYASITATAPASVLPEQAGNWAYPDSGMSPERFALSLVNAIPGRMYLSGYLNRMTDAERGRVREAVLAQKTVVADLARTHAFWPLGMPDWDAEWVAMALAVDDIAYLSLWHRADAGASIDLPMPQAAGRAVRIEPFFPVDLPGWTAEWDSAAGVLRVGTTVAEPSARVWKVTFAG